jgi:PiT family inorganic phosphate transporter
MTLVIVIIILALLFDYINGFHDAANSIATIVSTKVLTPLQAVIWAAAFNFVAFFIFKDHAVANTIGKTVTDTYITLPVIISGLIAAIMWNLLTWWYGIPSSSSHTLIGGFAGAALCHAYLVKGWVAFSDVVELEKISQTLLFIFLAPLIGMVTSMGITLITIMRNTWIRSLFIIAAAIATWFMFDYFKHEKMKENLTKFLKADKYRKEIAKDPENTKIREKLEKAEENLAIALPFVKEYNQIGAEGVASKISEKISFSDLEISKLKDILLKQLKADQLKKEAFYDASKQPLLDSINLKIDALKPVFRRYHEIGAVALADSSGKVFNLAPDEVYSLSKLYVIDLKKDLTKDLDKADNSLLASAIMLVVLIFLISYIYVEKIKTPNAFSMANTFKRLQLLSSAAFSIGHGGNDAQKVMGIIGAALIANGNINDFKELPDWVPLACYAAIGLGTLSGGWKIVKTMGTKITKVTPLEGVSAETAGAMTLFMTEQMGIPVSTTHTITGAIIGVGATKRLSAVRWGVTRSLLVAWILTIPVSAVAAGIIYLITHLIIS